MAESIISAIAPNIFEHLGYIWNYKKNMDNLRTQVTFESRELVLENIMKALQDETKNMIGVYGFGGMGKTTLVKQVAKRAEEEKMFEEIVFAPVTQMAELKKIQEKIASMLDLRLNNSNETESAGLIYGRLKGKKVLVILDDLWEELDLNAVGIPSGAEHMSCKILLTSRTSRVLSSVGTKIDFQLRALEEEEAWRLFEEKTIDVIKDPTFFAIGKKVAKRCAGLPVLIVTTAASLSKRPTVPAWNDALKQLKKMDNKQIHEIVNFAMKTISYNHLEEKHKKLFLLCGLVGGNVSVEHLLQYSWGLDMFDGEVATMGEARDRLHAWILDLKESCLLLDSDNRTDRNSINMHDVIRDVAFSIAEKDFNMLSVEGSGAELNMGHKDGILERCTGIVFRGGPNQSCLPQQLECPSLELCVLSRQYEYGQSSFNIPNTFFEKTSNLKVLDVKVSTLPSSLSFLKNLLTFRVDDCYGLKDISIVGELKKLQTLSLVGSGIKELPSAIGKLVELRLLDLSYCRQLRIIPAGLIAGLSRLEELKMRGSFDRWDVEDRFNPSGRANVSLLELNHLPNLTSLEIEVSNAKLLSKDLSFEKWGKYQIIVGDMWSSWEFRLWLGELEVTRKVCLQLSTTSMNHLQHVVEKLFKRTECLCLGELKGVKNVTPELDVDGFPYMKHLHIERDDEIQYIVNVEYRQHEASFHALESLHLSHLEELQKICNGRLVEKSFYLLNVVEVKNCNRLESLFSFSMAIGLRCLQEICVSECSVLQEIVAEKNSEDDDVNCNDEVHEKIEFLQLRKLSLKCLPKLNNFFGVKTVSIQKKRQKSLTTNVESEDIVSEEAAFKSSMFCEKVSFPKLKALELSEISNFTQIWSHKLSERPCCNLTRLIIEKCNNLQHVLTPSISVALVGLRYLMVKSCVKMKSIVAEEEGETKIGAISFPHLSYICLESLPNLTTFYSRSVVEMDPKESLDIALQPLFTEKIQFPRLERLIIARLDNISSIWQNQKLYKVKEVNITNSAARNQINLKMESREVSSFQNIQQVVVRECKSLEHVFPLYVARSLYKLEELIVEECEELKTMIVDQNHMETPEVVKATGQVVTTFTFPKLAILNLVNLPKGKCFYLREHTTECPLLEVLEIRCCGKIWLFDSRTTREKQRDNQLEKEAERLATTLPQTSSSNHFEAEENVGSWDSKDQEENVADIYEKGIGKEVWVSEQGTEDCDKYEETPRHSDPSCSNCTGPEQTFEEYLASSQHAVASSSQLIPQNNNHVDEVNPSLATQEAERLATIPSISSTNNLEEQAHDNQPEHRGEQTIEVHNATNKKEKVDDTCEKGKEKEPEVSLHGMERIDKSKDTSRPLDPTFSNYAAREQSVAASSSQLSLPISNPSDGVRASSLATQVEAETPAVTVSTTSSNNQFEAEAQFHDKSPKKSTDEPRKEGQSCKNGIEELRREVGISSDASNSQRKDFQESHVVKGIAPSMREFLQTEPPVDNISAEQVQFMEHAVEWNEPYLQKSRESVERNKAISELKLEIAEMEVRMQELKKKQKALEDENKVTA